MQIEIRVKPSVGDLMVINQAYCDANPLFTQYIPGLKPGQTYEILNIGEDYGEWGITSIKNVDTEEVLDITTVQELDSYWAMFDKYDSFRVFPQ